MNPSRVRWGIFWILVGLVFLANNLGWLSWWVWADLLHLWPILLITIGLEMIVKKSKAQWLGYVSTLLIIGAFAWAIFAQDNWYHEDFRPFRSGTSEVKCDQPEATSAHVDVRFDDGRIYFNQGRDYLFRAKARSSREVLSLKTDCEGNRCGLELTPSGSGWRFIRFAGDDDNNWRCYSHPGADFSYSLDLEDAILSFYGRELLVDTLKIEANRSDLTVRLGDGKRLVYLELDGRRSDLNLYLPDSAGIKFEGEGLSSTSIGRFDLTELDGIMSNDLYGQARANFLIQSDLRNGKIRLRRY